MRVVLKCNNPLHVEVFGIDEDDTAFVEFVGVMERALNFIASLLNKSAPIMADTWFSMFDGFHFALHIIGGL